MMPFSSFLNRIRTIILEDCLNITIFLVSKLFFRRMETIRRIDRSTGTRCEISIPIPIAISVTAKLLRVYAPESVTHTGIGMNENTRRWL